MIATASWKDLCRRALTMDRAEMADRLRQRMTALADIARYKAGTSFAPRLKEGVPSTRFFFPPEAVDQLCARLRHLFPEIAEQIVERAERICEHRFDLLGFRDLDYGREIDWHCDRVHGKRAPRKPWFLVRYLDFAQVGDSKVTWELNRHQHLVTLAKAFRLTGKEKFAAEIFSQWEHWHAQNPYPIGINWASSLEVAFRSLSWCWVYYLLAGSSVMPRGFRARWLRSQAISGRHIDCYLSTYFSPNTHLLGEAVALFFIGTLCPEIPSARRWQQRGWAIVRQEAERQVRADGLHFEQSLYYHVYALDFLLHTALLASVNQMAVPEEFDRTMERMLEALSVVARNGSVPQLGDDDGGRLFDGSRNKARHMLDPLATGAVLFGRGDFKTLAGGPREETLWLLGEEGIAEFDRLPAVPCVRNSMAFRESGLYVMPGDDLPRQLVIDAGPQGAHSAGHGHADALSLTATIPGCELLIDSGSFEYVGADGERDGFRGTRAHNTLVIDGGDQSEPKGPFSWNRLVTSQAEAWIAGKTFDYFAGSHNGYSRLPNGVVHRRQVFSLKTGLWLVRDLALGVGQHQLDLCWHLGPTLEPHERRNDLFLQGEHGLQFVTVAGNEWTQVLEQGFHSPVYGKKEKHRVLRFSAKAQLPAEFVTLLLLVTDASPSEHNLTRMVASNSAPAEVAAYRYQSGQDEHCILFGQDRPWKQDSCSSDAEFLYWGRMGSPPALTLICCRATYVEWAGKPIFKATQRVSSCEIIGNADHVDVVCPDPEGVEVNRDVWKALAADFRPQPAGNRTSGERS